MLIATYSKTNRSVGLHVSCHLHTPPFVSTKGVLSSPPSPRLCESMGLETLLNPTMLEKMPAFYFFLNIIKPIANKVLKMVKFKIC